MENLVRKTTTGLSRKEQKAIALAIYRDFESLTADGRMTVSEAAQVIMKRYGYRTEQGVLNVRRRVKKKLSEGYVPGDE